MSYDHAPGEDLIMDRYQEEIHRVVATKVNLEGLNGGALSNHHNKLANRNGIVRGSVANARVSLKVIT